MWFTFGLFVLLLWAVGVAIGASKRVQMLYNECTALNTRWKVTCEFLTRKAIRDALQQRPEWTPQDEQALQLCAQRLEGLGVSLQSLGIQPTDVAASPSMAVH